MSHCPSQDWDRYCAMEAAPYPVGQPFLTRSPIQHHCENCYGPIKPSRRHFRQEAHDDEGRFCGAFRWHMPNDPDCQPEEWEDL